MGSRSRKRGKAAAPPVRKPAAPPRPAPPRTAREPVPGPLDEFSAVAAPAPRTEAAAAAPTLGKAPAASAAGAVPPGEKPKRLRGEEANEAIRAQLQPLAPGERPRPLQAAIALAIVLGTANLVMALLDVRVEDDTSSRAGGLIFAGIMFAAAWGMWNVRYWAILGFQTLLAITVVIASLAITVSSNVWALLLCLAVVGLFGWLFWKLVRVLSRVQMPERPGP